MTVDEALRVLRDGGKFGELAEAIGVAANDPATSLDAIMLGLKYPGFVAEQAAFALYKRTFRSLPMDRNRLVTDPEEWARWLARQGLIPRKSPARARPDLLGYLEQIKWNANQAARAYRSARLAPSEHPASSPAGRRRGKTAKASAQERKPKRARSKHAG